MNSVRCGAVVLLFVGALAWPDEVDWTARLTDANHEYASEVALEAALGLGGADISPEAAAILAEAMLRHVENALCIATR